MFIDILRCLRKAVRRKFLEKLRTNSWFFLYDNAPAHRSVLVKHPPYFSDLVATDFHLLSPLKSALKGRRFYNAADIIKNAT